MTLSLYFWQCEGGKFYHLTSDQWYQGSRTNIIDKVIIHLPARDGSKKNMMDKSPVKVIRTIIFQFNWKHYFLDRSQPPGLKIFQNQQDWMNGGRWRWRYATKTLSAINDYDGGWMKLSVVVTSCFRIKQTMSINKQVISINIFRKINFRK